MSHNICQELHVFSKPVFVIFPLYIDSNRKKFSMWCKSIQNMALYKRYNIELYVFGINISEKTATGKTKSFYKHVENIYSTLSCHQNEARTQGNLKQDHRH